MNLSLLSKEILPHYCYFLSPMGPIHHFGVSFLSSPLMIPLASLLKQPCEQAHIVEKAANSAAFLKKFFILLINSFTRR